MPERPGVFQHRMDLLHLLNVAVQAFNLLVLHLDSAVEELLVVLQLMLTCHALLQFGGQILLLVLCNGLVEAALLHELHDLLLELVEFREVDAGKLIDISVEVLQLLVVLLFESRYLLLIILLLHLTLAAQLLQLRLRGLELLFVVLRGGRTVTVANALQFLGLAKHNLYGAVVLRIADDEVFDGLPVHHFVAVQFDAAELDGIAGMQRTELQRECSVGCAHHRCSALGSHRYAAEWGLLFLAAILQHHTFLLRLSQHTAKTHGSQTHQQIFRFRIGHKIKFRFEYHKLLIIIMS